MNIIQSYANSRAGDRAGFFVVKNVSRQKKKSMHFHKDQSNKAVDAGRASVRP